MAMALIGHTADVWDRFGVARGEPNSWIHNWRKHSSRFNMFVWNGNGAQLMWLTCTLRLWTMLWITAITTIPISLTNFDVRGPWEKHAIQSIWLHFVWTLIWARLIWWMFHYRSIRITLLIECGQWCGAMRCDAMTNAKKMVDLLWLFAPQTADVQRRTSARKKIIVPLAGILLQ